MVIGNRPEDVNSTDCVTVVFTGTIPKAMLVALALNPAAPTFNCKANVTAVPPALAASVTVSAELTGETVAVKLAMADPAATVTVAGKATAGLSLARFTTKPPLGAAAFSVTEQLSVPAPVIDPIAQFRPLNTGISVLPWPPLEAFNCRKNVSATLPAPAVNVAVCTELTEATAAVKLAEVDPAATVTLAGKSTAALLLARFTTKPPSGAAALNVTAQPSLPPPVIEPKVQLRPFKAGFPVLPGLR